MYGTGKDTAFKEHVKTGTEVAAKVSGLRTISLGLPTDSSQAFRSLF